MQYSGTYHTQIGAMIGRNQEIFKLLGPGGLAKAWKLRPRSGKPRPSPLVDPSTLEPPSKVISDESKNLDKFFKILNPSKGEPSND